MLPSRVAPKRSGVGQGESDAAGRHSGLTGYGIGQAGLYSLAADYEQTINLATIGERRKQLRR
jgi:hypothetical protein